MGARFWFLGGRVLVAGRVAGKQRHGRSCQDNFDGTKCARLLGYGYTLSEGDARKQELGTSTKRKRRKKKVDIADMHDSS